MIPIFETRALPVSFKEVDFSLKKIHEQWKIEERYNDHYTIDFLKNFLNFLPKNIEIEGLAKLTALPSFGITGAFEHFYLMNESKTLLLMQGEYPYHEHFFKAVGRNYQFWNLEKPKQPSFLIISQPFSADGNVIENLNHIIELCENWNIDVLIDLSFSALTKKHIYIRQSPCIKAISFSLSKMFDVGNYRIGITFWQNSSVPASILRTWTYENHFNYFVGLQLLKSIKHEELKESAFLKQKEICQEHNLTPSDSYLFGLSREKKWSSFFRRESLARICLSRLISEELRAHPTPGGIR